VNDEQPPGLLPEELVGALVRHKVQFVIVGGFAALQHGATRPTKDLDVCPARHRDNLERLAGALQDLDATLKLTFADGQPPDVRVEASVELLWRANITLWRTRAGDIDVLAGIPRGRGGPEDLARFDELHARAVVFHVGETTLLVASLDDIIRSKEIADRPKDREALPELRALRDAARPP
jgi:hypothetical protein